MLPLVNGDTLEKYPEIAEVLSCLDDFINDDTMQYLNYRVVELGEDRAQVARDFLLENGLVTEEELGI